jgi:hypothetical protein
MNKFVLDLSSLAFLIIFLLVNPSQSLSAKEDTAHLSLKKTAVSNEKSRPYKVKKGEWLFDIMRNELGVTSHRFSIIKKLNPQLKNMNMIHPGQVIMLPENGSAKSEPAEEAVPESTYKAKIGDSITRIALRQLKAGPSEASKAVRQIQLLNPGIKDFNKIYPGQLLQLPRRSITITQKDVTASQVESSEVKKEEQKEKTIMPPESRLDTIAEIISRMNGSLSKTGAHYIPIPKMGQVTIDCSTIPVAELDDGSSILIDFNSRVPDSLKKMIETNWKNYHVVKIDSIDNLTDTLQKIINASNTYAITKVTTPVVIGKTPTVQFTIDWMIAKKGSDAGEPYRQGLIFTTGAASSIPGPVIAYARKHELIITEIADHGVVTVPVTTYNSPEVTILPAATNQELAYAFLILLGYSPLKDTEVRAFDSARDGFNLSITADLLVKKGDRSLMIHSKKLPQQFVDALNNNRGIDTLFLDDTADRKAVIEKVIQGMNIRASFEIFSFSEPQKINQPKCSVTFPAFKIIRDNGTLYMIDFSMDGDLYRYLYTKWEVNLVRF